MQSSDLGPILCERRLSALRGACLLDTPPEPNFDRLTRMASRLLQAPVALISLVDADRQFFKSSVGLPAPWCDRRQTPLSHSFCKHVVIEGRPLVVGNALDDPRFRDNGAVSDLGVVAYLGVPLALPDDGVLGALCVIDATARTWTDEDVQTLRDLADSVMTEIQLRGEAQTLRTFSALVEHSSDFIATAALDGSSTYINPAGRALVGLRDGEPAGDGGADVWMSRASWGEAIASSLAQGQWFGELALRHVRTGERIEGEANVFPVYEPGGARPVCVATIVRDVRARKQTETQLIEGKALLEGILESLLDGLIVIDSEGRVADVNTTAASMFGLPRDKAIGLAFGSLVIPGGRKNDVDEGFGPFLSAGAGPLVGRRVEAVGLRADGRRFPVEMSVNSVMIDDRLLCHAAVRDISDRKEAEARLLESEEFFRGSFDNAPIGMALVATDGRWMRVNPEFCEMLGYSEAELLALDFQSITHPDDLPADLANVERLLSGAARSYQMEKRYCHKDGHDVWVVLSASLIRDNRGQPLYFVSQINDVSERKRAEESLSQAHRELEQRVCERTAQLAATNEALQAEIADRIRIEQEMRESEERFRSLADAMPQLVWAARPDGTIIYQNRRSLAMTGPAGPEPGLMGWASSIHPDDRERSHAAWCDAIHTGHRFQVEWRLFDRGSGAYRWHLARSLPIRDEDGPITQWYGTSTDIDDQKRAEEARRQSEDTFRGLVAATHEGVWILDEQARITFVNPQMAEMLGYEPSELVGRRKWDMLFEEDRESAKALFERRRRGLGDRADIRFRRRDGGILWTMMSARPVFDETGAFRGAIDLFNDITERKKAEEEIRGLNRSLESRVRSRTEELARAKEEAESATRAKGEFLANMSHEVRTPIAAVLGYAEMLLDPRLLDADRRSGLTAIRRNASHLLQIINDILDLSKIEAGRIQLDLMNYSPLQVVQDVTSTLGVAAEDKRIGLEVVVVGEIPEFGVMDPTRVRQVLSNLVSNAIKFSKHDSRVVIRVGTRSVDVDRAHICLEVEDHGIGMTPEQMENLFRPFHQADSSTTRKYGGTGLGLSICRCLVEIMGGFIQVRSVHGEGSCFTVEIPLLPVDDRLEWPALDESGSAGAGRPILREPAAPVRLAGRVLLAEDSADNQRVLLYHLGQLGLDVETVENGRLAVERAQAGGFDLVLMDMQMPELDGYQATRALRKAGYTRPIIAVTAHAMTQDREKCLRAGCSEFLTKPVNVRTMTRVLAEQLGAGESARPPADVERADATAPAEVDDAIVSEYWELQGFQSLIREYVDGLPGLASQLQAMAAAGDAAGVKKLAHRLSGSGGMYGYTCLSDAAHSLELAADEHHAPKLIGRLVDGFAELVGKVVRGLEHAGAASDDPPPCPDAHTVECAASAGGPATHQPRNDSVEGA